MARLNSLPKKACRFGSCNKGTTLQLAEKPDALKGHEFTRAIRPAKSSPALAAEGCFRDFVHQ